MPVFETLHLSPLMALALVGVLGVGAQWVAWRLRLPAIVLMLGIGLLVGPVLGIFDPHRDIGPLTKPMITIAVAIILFEGGLTLDFRSLRGAAGEGVLRLVVLGAPFGWLFSALALHWVAGLSLASSAVFGGLMIVTGPTVIAPLLRNARLRRQPAALLQWEAIVNDPVGALAAVLALEVVLVMRESLTRIEAIANLAVGTAVAALIGLAAGAAVTWTFSRAKVPEYMKVPVLFVAVLAVFAIADFELHESGLLTVTIMGLWIANAGLPSLAEIRRFKEHATLLLVSGVFILLAAGMSFENLALLNWRSFLFILAVILLVRPATVLLSMAFSGVSWPNRLMVAFTGPRGVVMIAVAGLFGERLVAQGIADAALIAPLSFALVLTTVIVHGFGLGPLARVLGATATGTPGVLIIGGSPWSVAFAQRLRELNQPVLISDTNYTHLRGARQAGINSFFGDILSEDAERAINFVSYNQVVAVTDNDAYNTLLCTDFGHRYGREFVFQPKRGEAPGKRIHKLPATLGGRALRGELTIDEFNQRMQDGWTFRTTRITEEFTLDNWRKRNGGAYVLASYHDQVGLRIFDANTEPRASVGTRLIGFYPPERPGAG